MSNVYPLLQKLVMNRKFIEDFVSEKAPCFAVGMIEEKRKNIGLLALRPGKSIPPEVTARGLNFGHSLFGNDHYQVIHLAFEFYGFCTYNVLLNPSNPLVRTVLRAMVEYKEYFFLSIGQNQDVTAFRSEISQEILNGISASLEYVQRSTTSDMEYQEALQSFQKCPISPGFLLTWVCRDNPEYLDLTTDRLELTPSHTQTKSHAETKLGDDQRQVLAKRLNEKVNMLIRNGINDDLSLLAQMVPDMSLFKKLMDLSGEDGMDDLVDKYDGLYHFAKLLERIAAGIQSGNIKVPT